VAAVELAVLLPVMIFLLLLAIDFCRIFYFTNCVENAARQGALFASDSVEAAKSPYADVTAAVQGESGLSPAPTVSTVNGTDSAGNACIDVTVSWTFNTVAGCPGIANTWDLARTVRARVAPQAPQ
jgi:Flp pilus assembly protein TadG